MTDALLFTCSYGSGHHMATQAIREHLDMSVRIEDIYQGPLKPLEPLREYIPEISSEHVYNSLMRQELYGILNMAGKVLPHALSFRRGFCIELLVKYLQQTTPRLIICCVPLIVGILYEACAKLRIPLIVITTDLDIWAFCVGFSSPLDPNLLYITVPYPQKLWDPFFLEHVPKPLRSHLLYNFGYPIRKGFTQPADPHIFETFDLCPTDLVVLIMMGGNSGHTLISYANAFNQLSRTHLQFLLERYQKVTRLHVIGLCGNGQNPAHQKIAKHLNALDTHPELKIQGIENTPHLPQLTSHPHLLAVLTKPGGSTVNEMLYQQIPLLLHSHGTSLDWEKGNLEYAIARGLGFLTSPSKKPLHLLSTLHQAIPLKKQTEPCPESQTTFGANLRALIKKAQAL